MLESLIIHPEVAVADAEYRRLLGYPRRYEPGERARELAAAARRWYAEHGRPWVYLRETTLDLAPDVLRLDGEEFASWQLRDHFQQGRAERAVFVAVSAGRACEDHARRLWQEGKPDEYFFLEIFGSAVVEHLVATTSGRLCDLAERDGFSAIPHYSPGYAGWDVAEQERLFALITRGLAQPLPEPIEVLPGGMLKPKKSLLAVFGLARRPETASPRIHQVPCPACSFSPCQYRRAPYRHAPGASNAGAAAGRPAAPGGSPAGGFRYTVNERALRKWAGERVRVIARDDGAIEACFRFDGTTCSNLGKPLAFDYVVTLGPAADDFRIIAADCRPAPGDTGHRQMCAYLNDAEGLMAAIATEKPLLGRPLREVLEWARPAAPAGCYCQTDSRAHKWGLALEVLHYTLTHPGAGNPSRAALADAVSTIS